MMQISAVIASFLLMPSFSSVQLSTSLTDSQNYSQSDSQIEALSERISSSLVEFDFSFIIRKNGIPNIEGTGKIRFQDNDYIIWQNGLEIRNHDGAVWTIDRVAREIIIEKADDASSGFLSNPSALLSSIEDFFECTALGNGSFDGIPCKVFNLKPKSAINPGINVAEIVEGKLYISSDGSSIAGMDLILSGKNSQISATDNGTTSGTTAHGDLLSGATAHDEVTSTATSLRIFVKNFKLSDKVSQKEFSIDISSLDNDYIITDLR